MLLHSLNFDIRSRSIAFSDWPDQLYRSNDLRSRFPSHSSSLTLEVERADSPFALDIEPITSDSGVFAEIPLSGGMCYYNRGKFFSECDGEFKSATEFNPVAGTIRMNVSGRFADVGPQALLGLVVKPVMQSFVLPFFNLKSLHAASVARNDKTIMLMGKGGAGKSTAALSLMPSGFALLSDDTSLFTVRGSEVFALSSLDSAHVTASTLSILPFLKKAVVGDMDHRAKFTVSPFDLQPSDAWKEPRKVTHVVELNRTTVTSPRFVKIDPSFATAALLGESMTVFRDAAFASSDIYERHSRLSFDVITGLMRNARVLRLDFADHHLDALPQLFDDLN